MNIVVCLCRSVCLFPEARSDRFSQFYMDCVPRVLCVRFSYHLHASGPSVDKFSLVSLLYPTLFSDSTSTLQIFRDTIASYKSQVNELQEHLRRLQNKHMPDVEPFRVKIQALPKDVVASKPHLLALMEVPEHRPYVRTPRASARPSREGSPDRPGSSLSWFQATPSGPAASGLTPEALVQGVFQSPKLVARCEDDITDIQVPVPSLPTGTSPPPVTEIKVVYAPSREDAAGVRPKKRVDDASLTSQSKKAKPTSQEGSTKSTTVVHVLQTSSQVQEPLTTTVINTHASAVTLPSVSTNLPVVASPTDSPSGPTPVYGERPQQRVTAFATEMTTHSPPRDISEDQV